MYYRSGLLIVGFVALSMLTAVIFFRWSTQAGQSSQEVRENLVGEAGSMEFASTKPPSTENYSLEANRSCPSHHFYIYSKKTGRDTNYLLQMAESADELNRKHKEGACVTEPYLAL